MLIKHFFQEQIASFGSCAICSYKIQCVTMSTFRFFPNKGHMLKGSRKPVASFGWNDLSIYKEGRYPRFIYSLLFRWERVEFLGSSAYFSSDFVIFERS